MSGKATPPPGQAAVQADPPADSTLDADIAAFIAEGHEPDDEPSIGDEPEPEPDGDTDESEEQDDDDEDSEADGDDDGEDSADDDAVADEDSAEDDDEGEPPAPPASVELRALEAAIAADDPVAFVKALGAKADTLLTGKAHKALRLQVKEFENAQSKANLLATQLGEKYGDPIAARKAAETGDVDAFIAMVEKWAGHPWNDVQRWVTSGIAGRPARLEQKAREEQSATATAKAKQEQAQEELRVWVDGGVKKLAPELHSDEVTALVVAEIRAGFNKGITTPAKALPLVKAKLEAQYKRLHAVFGKGTKPAKGKSPSTRVERPQVGGGTRETTLDEDIADFMKENGLRSSVPKKKKKKGSK